jgi:hypothetical protein
MNKKFVLKGKKRGTRNSQVAVVKKSKGEEEVLMSSEDTSVIEVSEPSLPASAGLSMGLTIPGPRGSYASARIDIWATIPCHADDQSVKDAYERVGNLVEEELTKNSGTIITFFKNM